MLAALGRDPADWRCRVASPYWLIYAGGMNNSSSRSFGRTAVAGLILLVAAWVLLHFLIHLAVFVASIVAVVVAIAAVIWALRVLL
jgi:hypothetical protein